jgi:hypothetical protein
MQRSGIRATGVCEFRLVPAVSSQIAKPGHGRLPHSAYINTIEHHINCNFKSGDPCPMLCNGKLYSIDPGVIVRVKGQNLAAVHKYWIEKLRCALCGYIISATTPNHIRKPSQRTYRHVYNRYSFTHRSTRYCTILQ